jgi:hypothetical protein
LAVAAVSPTVSIVLFFSVPLLYFLLVTLLRDRGKTEAEAEDFT